MTKLYISPTNQPNTYPNGKTTEQKECAKIAKTIGKYLSEYDVTYHVGDETKMMWITDANGNLTGGRIKDAIAWKADWYFEIHTNAGSKTATGAVSIVRTGIADRERMANALVGALNALAVKANPAFKSNRSESIKEGYTTHWGAVRYPELGGVKGMLLEVNFHENPAVAEWIIANTDSIGKTIADTIAKELKLKKKTTTTTTTVEPTRFPDVPKTHWAYDHIENLAEAGLIKGYADGTFRPDEPITRAQVCKIVDLAMQLMKK